MLNQKMGKTPEVTPRKRFLQDNTSENVQTEPKGLVKEGMPYFKLCSKKTVCPMADLSKLNLS